MFKSDKTGPFQEKEGEEEDDEMVEQSVCDGIDLKWIHEVDSDEEEDTSSFPSKVHERVSVRGRLRRILLRSPRSRLVSTVFDIVATFLCCLLYSIRVQLDHVNEYKCAGSPCVTEPDLSPKNADDGMVFSSAEINWHVLLWVHRSLPIWIAQVVIALTTFSKTLILICITKGSKLDQIISLNFFLEFVCSFPFVVMLCYPPLLKNLYSPGFLYCWLCKTSIQRLFNDLHLTRQRFQSISVTMTQQIVLLVVTVCCICFTTMCGIQHIQRGSLVRPLTMFESFYFTIVTLTTVGYGDISPDIWLGQLFMVIMIVVAFACIPKHIEEIYTTYIEREKTGGEYNKRQALRCKHVVVSCRNLTASAVMNFLTEFNAHRKLQNYIVILLCPLDPEGDMQMILRDPKWSNRVRYMKGSALKDLDLMRCRINEAECLFLLSPPNATDKETADKQIILRSWAVKDFAPNCNQYIQLFRAENKVHVKFAEHVVCEDEFKYALLANNCLYPGVSTLVDLLLHTSTGCEGDFANEPWQQVYGKHSGNEIYHIQLCNSKIFGQFEGRKFTEASVEAHEKYGVTLLAVMDVDETRTDGEPRIQLNPGSNYILNKYDYCFYVSVAREENTSINRLRQQMENKLERQQNYEKKASELENMISTTKCKTNSDDEYTEESVFNTLTSMPGGQNGESLLFNRGQNIQSENLLNQSPDENTGVLDTPFSSNKLNMFEEEAKREYTVGRPPPMFFVGSKNTECHMMKVKRSKCCLKWGEDCSHVTYKNANSSRWGNNLIILTAQQINLGLYNFILPLRSSFISTKSLRPIILMFEEEEPSSLFLENLTHFAMVFWMKGKLTCIDDLLIAGINKASHLVVVNREINCDPTQIDADTIVNVQTVRKLFPSINILTELSEKENMRFMNFQAIDEYTLHLSRLEKKLKENNCVITHLFRHSFAAGLVLSASMLDTLLYQTFVKGYLIKFVRLLLGIDSEPNSGHLSSIKVKKQILLRYRTYGELYKGLCTVTGEIPIAIYRTERRKLSSHHNNSEIPVPSHTVMENNNIRKGKHTERKVSLNVQSFAERSEQNDVTQMIQGRMKALHIDDSSYNGGEQVKTISYVILNPTPHRRLKNGDIVYVIQPCSMFAVPSRLNRKPVRRMSWSYIPDSARKNIYGNRSRSQSMEENFTSQTVNDIPNKSIPAETSHEISAASIVPNNVFATETVNELMYRL